MKSRVAELEAELEAAQRTIDALSDAMERGLSEASTDVPLTLQMLSLEQLVHERTHELASRQGELQAALDELGRTQAQLLSAQKLEAIGQLAAGIAHEINTPMQYIGDNTAFLQTAFTELLGYVARLEAAVGDTVKPSRKVEFVKERVGPAVDQTIEGVAAVSRLVQGMRSFAHPGSEEKEPTDINDSLETTVTVCRNEWKYVSEVELELEPGLPLVPALRAELSRRGLTGFVVPRGDEHQGEYVPPRAERLRSTWLCAVQ